MATFSTGAGVVLHNSFICRFRFPIALAGRDIVLLVEILNKHSVV